MNIAVRYTQTDVRSQLVKFVADCRSQAEAARRLGLSTTYLSDLLNEHREITDVVARKLGFRKVEDVYFVKE